MGVDAAIGALLNAFAAAGVFRLGGTIVGTHAFRPYEGELGLRFHLDQSAQTDDVDIASFEACPWRSTTELFRHCHPY